jgi:hypothetical protein
MELRTSEMQVLAGVDDLELCRLPARYTALGYKEMSAPFYRAVRAAFTLDSVANCNCRHVLRPRKAWGREQARCLSGTSALQSGHSYAAYQ